MYHRFRTLQNLLVEALGERGKKALLTAPLLDRDHHTLEGLQQKQLFNLRDVVNREVFLLNSVCVALDEPIHQKPFKCLILRFGKPLNKLLGIWRHLFPEQAGERHVANLCAFNHALADP